MGAQTHQSIIGGACDATLEAAQNVFGCIKVVSESVPDLFRPSEKKIVDLSAVVRGIGHALSYVRFAGSVATEHLRLDR